MAREEIIATALEVLRGIAPETASVAIDPARDIREQVDIDSMDYLNFVIGLDEAFGAGIPEREYTKFTSLDACADIIGRLAAGKGAAAKGEEGR